MVSQVIVRCGSVPRMLKQLELSSTDIVILNTVAQLLSFSVLITKFIGLF